MKNPFKVGIGGVASVESKPIHSNSRIGGQVEAEYAKRMFGGTLNISPFNKRVRLIVRHSMAMRKPQTPRMDCRQARRNP